MLKGLSRGGGSLGLAPSLFLVGVGLAVGSCAGPDPNRVAATGDPGTAIPGLDSASMAQFSAGQLAFNRVYRAEEGLGPAFNENQCSACHTSPASGGLGGELVFKASRFDPAKGCDVMASTGGENIRRKITPVARDAGIPAESAPPGGTVGQFTAPALFGLGFVDAIPEETLRMREDPDDRDGDGISGRMGRSTDGRPARLGRKADVPTIGEFVAGAIRLEMGLTTPIHPQDALQGEIPPPEIDPAADPEVDQATLDLLTQYVRFLAPPPRGGPTRGLSEASVARGEASFSRIGCTACHVPSLTTGPSDIDALDRREIALYSDLLLHDMGPDLADVCGPGATPSEIRTEPLMGLRYRDLLLHDGRITDLTTAIHRHGGEATQAREGFKALSEGAKEELLAFLRTL